MPKTQPAGLLKQILWVFCRVWLICGVGTLAVGLAIAVYTSIWLQRSVLARGTVMELVPQDGDDTINYATRFEFKSQDGKLYTVTSGVATNPPGFKVGEDVRVRYLSNDPASAKLSYFWQLWFVPVLCAGLGVFFTGAGYLLLRYERRSLSGSSQPSPQAALANG
jgi:hypothetical protein